MFQTKKKFWAGVGQDQNTDADLYLGRNVSQIIARSNLQLMGLGLITIDT